MKTIPLKVAPLIIDGQSGTLDYRAQLQAILRAPSNPGAGADYEEIRRSLRVLDVLETSNGELKLEDADYEYLKARVMSARFMVIDRVVQTFIEDMTA